MKIETSRLMIREFQKNDLDELALLLGDSEVMRFSLKGPIGRKDAETYLENIMESYKRHGHGLWALFDKKEGHFIGLAGVSMQKLDGIDQPEVGYRLLPKYWGKGFAAEGVKAVIEYAFNELKMDKIISIIDPQNTRSIKVAQRMGMRHIKDTTYHGFHVGIYELRREAPSEVR